MIEDTDTNEAGEGAGIPGSQAPLDDDRFEVKWRKKESNSPPQRQATEEQRPAAEGESDDDLRQRLSEAEKRATGLQERWQRAAADLSNLRKRTEQDRADMEKFSSMMVVAELLPVLDNFERALATIPGNLAMLTWVQGVMLIERHLRAILEHQGLSPIEADRQPFDPHFHEAIAEQPTGDAPPGTVMRILQQGYTMHGRVIRPALVELAASPVETEASASVPESTDDEQPEEITVQAQTDNAGP